MFLDGILVMVSLRIAQAIRPGLSSWAEWIREIPTPPKIEFYIYIIFAIIWVLIFLLMSLYNPYKYLKRMEFLGAYFAGCLLASIVIPGFLYFIEREMSRVLFLSFAVLASVILLSYRIFYQWGFKNGIIKTSENRRILIAGAGLVGKNVRDQIENYQHYGFNVVGFVDDDVNKLQNEVDILGNLDQTVEIIEERDIQHLIIALPRRAYDRINRLISEVHELPVRVWVIPDYFALALNQASITDFAGFPLIDLRAPALNNYQRITKRIFDLMIVVPLFILTLPLFGLISLLIKLDSKGPILYKSERIKEFGETFEMLKFRTMVNDADEHLEEIIQKDEEGNLIHKRPDDPRVTPIGKFLRKTSLDELPQFINILRGDMSFIGPRPELPIMVDRYEPWQRARFAVPQGLTGWWQVNGRSDKPMHLHTEEDIYYIQNYSFWLDIYILIKTIKVVLKGRGAY